MTASDAWRGALADFEATLDLATAALDDNDVAEIPEFAVPAVDGPLPAELRPRADDLLARSIEMVARIEAEQARIRKELARIPRVRATDGGGESRFETHA